MSNIVIKVCTVQKHLHNIMGDLFLEGTKVSQKQLILRSSKLFVSSCLQIYQASLNLTIEIKELKITHKQVTEKNMSTVAVLYAS